MERVGTKVHIGDNRTLPAYMILRPCTAKAGVRKGAADPLRPPPLRVIAVVLLRALPDRNAGPPI